MPVLLHVYISFNDLNPPPIPSQSTFDVIFVLPRRRYRQLGHLLCKYRPSLLRYL